MITRAAYVPALHHGYMEFVKKTEDGVFYVLSEDLVRTIPRMERDIRALGSNVVLSMLSTAFPEIEMGIIDASNVEEIMASTSSLVMPDEDVSRTFVDTYAQMVPTTTYESNFLRWDRMHTLEERVVNPIISISYDELDITIMKNARDEAKRSPDWWRQVGAILVLNNSQTLITHNRPYPEEHGTFEIFGDPRSSFDAGESIELSKVLHAEAGLIGMAAREGIALEGSDLYVTTFPCPNCAKLVAEAGIKRIFYSEGYSLLDAEDIFAAKGIDIILVKDPETPSLQK